MHLTRATRDRDVKYIPNRENVRIMITIHARRPRSWLCAGGGESGSVAVTSEKKEDETAGSRARRRQQKTPPGAIMEIVSVAALGKAISELVTAGDYTMVRESGLIRMQK